MDSLHTRLEQHHKRARETKRDHGKPAKQLSQDPQSYNLRRTIEIWRTLPTQC